MSSIIYSCLFATFWLSLAAANAPLSTDAPNPVAAVVDILPDQFYGTFEFDHEENFNLYLEQRGYSDISRKNIHWRTFVKVFVRTKDKTKFDFGQSYQGNYLPVYYTNIVLGTKIEEKLLEQGRQITFTLKDGHIFEHREPLAKSDKKEETFEMFFEKEFLVVRATYGGVEGRRFYKRIADADLSRMIRKDE